MDDTPFEIPQMLLCVYTVVGRQQNRPVILDLHKEVSLFWAFTGSELDDKVADIMLLVIGIIPPAVILLLVPVKIALLE